MESVRDEVAKARRYFANSAQLRLVGSGTPGSGEALTALLASLSVDRLAPSGDAPRFVSPGTDSTVRLHRQFDQLVAFTQRLIQNSPQRRSEFWSRAVATTPDEWRKTTRPLRDSIWSEVIGRLPDPSMPANPRTRLLYDTPKFSGYEVMLDVWPDVFAYGILLVPKGIKPGEHRPVVVCQHGLEGRPRDVADPAVDSHYYHRFAVQLAEEGLRDLLPAEPLHRRGSFPPDPTQGPSAEAVALLVHPGAAPAHPGMAGIAAVRGFREDRFLRTLLWRKDGGPRAAAARWLRAVHLLGRFQRVGLEDHQHRCAVTATCSPTNTTCSSSISPTR